VLHAAIGYFFERVEDLNITSISQILPGAFATERAYTREFQLEKGALYSLIFFDDYGDGLLSGGGTEQLR
jgi:hypothetical protein